MQLPCLYVEAVCGWNQVSTAVHACRAAPLGTAMLKRFTAHYLAVCRFLLQLLSNPLQNKQQHVASSEKLTTGGVGPSCGRRCSLEWNSGRYAFDAVCSCFLVVRSPVFKAFVHICALCSTVALSCSPAAAFLQLVFAVARKGLFGDLFCIHFNVWKNRDCGWLVEGMTWRT